MISEERAHRIENKLDELITVVNRLAIIDERQINSNTLLKRLEDRVDQEEEALEAVRRDLTQKIDAVDKKIDRWVNIGIGAWGLIGALLALYQTFRPLLAIAAE